MSICCWELLRDLLEYLTGLATGKTDCHKTLSALLCQGIATGAARSFHLTLTRETPNTVRVVRGEGWKLRALSHPKASPIEAPLKTAAPNSFRAEREGFLPVMGVKPCLTSAWGFAVTFGDSGFHHWVVYTDTGVGECELSWSTETMRRPATWRISCVVEGGGIWEGVETESITSLCKQCLRRSPLSGRRVLICKLWFICLCLGLLIYALSCETW